VWAAADAAPKPRDVDAAWSRFQRRLDEQESSGDEEVPSRKQRSSRRPSTRRRSSQWKKAGIVATCFALVVGIAVFLGGQESPSTEEETQVYVTQPGERTTVELSDGSSVTLNVDSRMRVGDAFGTDHRDVQLEGEAYFEVKEGETPFVVETENARVRVLGTAFGIRSYSLEKDVSVTVAEGTVGVNPADEGAGEKRLTENQRALVSASGRIDIVSEVSLDDYLGWREGRMVFKNTPLREVMWELERRYGHQTWLLDSQLAERHLTATFQSESLDRVLEVIALSLDIGYRKKDSTIVFGRSDRPDLKSLSPSEAPSN